METFWKPRRKAWAHRGRTRPSRAEAAHRRASVATVQLELLVQRKSSVIERFPSDLDVVHSRSGDGLYGRRRIGSTPAAGDGGTANAPRASLEPPAAPWPDEGIDQDPRRTTSAHDYRPAEVVEQRRALSLPVREHPPCGVREDGCTHTGEDAGDQLHGRRRPGPKHESALASAHRPWSPPQQRELTRLNDERDRPPCTSTVSETVAKLKPASTISGEKSDRQLPAGASRQAVP